MTPRSRIVDRPIGPGLLRRCPECRRWFALLSIETRERPDEAVPRIDLVRYECKHCGFVLEKVKEFDPRCLHVSSGRRDES